MQRTPLTEPEYINDEFGCPVCHGTAEWPVDTKALANKLAKELFPRTVDEDMHTQVYMMAKAVLDDYFSDG